MSAFDPKRTPANELSRLHVGERQLAIRIQYALNPLGGWESIKKQRSCRNCHGVGISMKTTAPVVPAVVLALLTPARAAPRPHSRHRKAATAAPPQIACTVVGCMPVPRGCHPEMGYTP